VKFLIRGIGQGLGLSNVAAIAVKKLLQAR
jgi:hypothetical protein